MNMQGLNLFIIDDDKLMASGLKHYLERRFGKDLIISTFSTGESALKKINKDTHMVILDYFLENENGNDVLMSIKKTNPETEVIMLSSNEDMGVAIDSFRKGASDFVVKGEDSGNKITSFILRIFMYPVEVLVKEFAISKYLAMFLLTFAGVGIAAYLVLKYIYKITIP